MDQHDGDLLFEVVIFKTDCAMSDYLDVPETMHIAPYVAFRRTSIDTLCGGG